VIPTLKTLAALGLALWAFGGFKTGSRKPADPNLYEVKIDFISMTGTTNHEIKVITSPDVPFAVQTQDETGHHYQMSGTLRKTGEHSVCLDQMRDSGPNESESSTHWDMELGKGWCVRAVDGMVLGGHDIVVTKK
jgi:hypothetical protein